MDDGHVTCPQDRRVNHRRKKQQKWRSTVRWKRLVKEHAQDPPDAECVYCHRKHGEPRLDKNGNQQFNKRGKLIRVILTINHKSRRSYLTEDDYCTWDKKEMEICCTVCNWKIESGYRPCPVCHRVYIKWTESICNSCYDKAHPEEAEQRRIKKEQNAKDAKIARKARLLKSKKPAAFLSFPCRFRLKEQHCEKGGICGYSKDNYQKCRQSQERPERRIKNHDRK
jgi:hypothetical protein